MKKAGVIFALLIFLSVFALALDEPSVTGSEDYESVQEAIEKLPIDESGQIDFNQSDVTTKADERIAKINEYVGPFSMAIFGVELSLSWIFIFSIILWILLIEIIVMPASEIFQFNLIGSLAASVVIASLAMHGIGNDFVVWMGSIVEQWWMGVTVIVCSTIAGVAYSLISKTIGANMRASEEQERKRKHERLLKTETDIMEKRMGIK